ncbi:GTP-binding protein [Pseudomonas sp. zfem002]|uniref:CobW family GTP-binding protein n=1 Tax=Pseudomonas sp. zfem002 TaxID=3078197 RepID=UPI0029284F83|nr:GTP-binding protein [Pseudomonas sp. zfem002]MDU9393261.1 GTP-binding protein [Pseudomonas sp. zfem002]
MLQIPATILTGFLGAGKTTLLKRLLEEPHGQRLAIIENEFGEENIDKEFLVTRSEEQIYQMSNGCICCSIRQDLREALLLLAEKRKQGELAFDRIVIETTGLADPGPVAQTFFADPAVAGLYLLDSIVTVVDARHAPEQLDKRQEASRQVGFADRLFISKSDLVSAGELRQLQERLGRINRRAPQKLLHHGKLDFTAFFDVRGFSLDAILDIDPTLLPLAAPVEHPGASLVCARAHVHDEHCGHHHHDAVSSFVFRSARTFEPEPLQRFLAALVERHGPQLLRYKGILAVSGFDRKFIFQGVHQIMGSTIGPRWKEDEKRESRLVFIGIDLPRAEIEAGLDDCLA